jgi:hypothetical protein
MEVGQGILQVGQLQLLDHALDQLGVAGRRRSGQAAGRAGAGSAQDRTPGDPVTSKRSNRPRMGGRTSLNRSARAWSAAART